MSKSAITIYNSLRQHPLPCSAERVIVDAGSNFTFFFPRLGCPEEAGGSAMSSRHTTAADFMLLSLLVDAALLAHQSLLLLIFQHPKGKDRDPSTKTTTHQFLQFKTVPFRLRPKW
ncbi:phosphopantothenoylcysteine decarboxylase subunit VHS3-like [Pyrus ussuriensis x Pyrus communis]|uniref:Phosphopantothenoylcysteine decarboxylase subunit VHS3-like n=1 Tax=Pyrus ussuriensis x Pyrus communis TaxID=2448454 RepID=A0A5N5FVA4_9ROSA|nr:phosphopantothenoylcysteine decarboxylase subunit VHS3-like [Pyrus ussuriensis x Pyrus communis]